MRWPIITCLGLAACGTVGVTPRPEYGADAFELSFQQGVISSGPTRDQSLGEKATEICRGPYQKLGETRGEPPRLTWIVKCLTRR